MKKKIAFALLSGLLFCLTSCASTYGLTQAKVKKALKEGTWGLPKNSALLFSSDFAYNDFLQQNPKFGYKFYPTTCRSESVPLLLVEVVTGSVSFIEPLPIGAELKLFSKTETKGRCITTTYYGIAGVDVVLDKPGLFYYAPDDPERKDELTALKILYNYFKGSNSEWESVIANRIEELKDAKK